MRLVFTADGREDHRFWQRADRAVLKRLNRLIEDALREPGASIGPEGDELVALQARYHYR